MWEKIKAWCMHSETVALHYVLAVVGVVVAALLQFPDVASSVGLAQYIPTSFVGYYTFGIAIITIAVRLRGVAYNIDLTRTPVGKESDHA